MSQNRKILYFCIVLAQLLFLAAMIFQRQNALNKGKTIVLKCRPVDPRSLFSGDYVKIDYVISRINLNSVKKIDEPAITKNNNLFVGLIQNDNTRWEVAAIAAHHVNLEKEYPVFIKGRVIGKRGKHLLMQYGIETFFVPQFKGRAIENQMANIETEVAISSTGTCALKRVFLNGEEVTFE